MMIFLSLHKVIHTTGGQEKREACGTDGFSPHESQQAAELSRSSTVISFHRYIFLHRCMLHTHTHTHAQTNQPRIKLSSRSHHRGSWRSGTRKPLLVTHPASFEPECGRAPRFSLQFVQGSEELRVRANEGRLFLQRLLNVLNINRILGLLPGTRQAGLVLGILAPSMSSSNRRTFTPSSSIILDTSSAVKCAPDEQVDVATVLAHSRQLKAREILSHCSGAFRSQPALRSAYLTVGLLARGRIQIDSCRHLLQRGLPEGARAHKQNTDQQTGPTKRNQGRILEG